MENFKIIIRLPDGKLFGVEEIKTNDWEIALKGKIILETGDGKNAKMFMRPYNWGVTDVFDTDNWADWSIYIEGESVIYSPRYYFILPNGQKFELREIQTQKGYYNFLIIGFMEKDKSGKSMSILVRSTTERIEGFFDSGWIDWKIISGVEDEEEGK